jgi:ribosomal protein L29
MLTGSLFVCLLAHASLSGVESHLDAVKDELANERERRAAQEQAQLAQRKQAAAPVARIATALAKQLIRQ